MERRTLLRILIVVGIGIPVVIEGATFLGLVQNQLAGDDGGTTPSNGPMSSRHVEVGDELVLETTQAETITGATIRNTDDGRVLTVNVRVENTADEVYELQLNAVGTASGERVEGGGTTGRIPPGETRSVSGQWTLPPDASPETMNVFGARYDDMEGPAQGGVSKQLLIDRLVDV
ncbi:hypothetical protein ACFQH6_07970 [Halobacteriaceae archaeon GCM10025711]